MPQQPTALGGKAARRAALALPAREFITDVEVAARYSLNLRTLRGWRIYGRGPKFRKLGRSVRYDVRELEEYFDALPCGGDGGLDGRDCA